MFFRKGEMLLFPGLNIHTDYQRYNQLAKGIYASKVGEIAVENFYRKAESSRLAKPKNIELSLWRVSDRNVSAFERGDDRSQFVIKKPDGERISYVVVPRMNTDKTDRFPCEYTDEKDATFEDINDPRVIVIARSYKGVIAEIAKDCIEKNEADIRTGYKFLADTTNERYCDFSNPQLLKAITEQAVQMFEPNVLPQPKFSRKGGTFAEDTYNYIDPISEITRINENPRGVDEFEDCNVIAPPEFQAVDFQNIENSNTGSSVSTSDIFKEIKDALIDKSVTQVVPQTEEIPDFIQ